MNSELTAESFARKLIGSGIALKLLAETLQGQAEFITHVQPGVLSEKVQRDLNEALVHVSMEATQLEALGMAIRAKQRRQASPDEGDNP